MKDMLVPCDDADDDDGDDDDPEEQTSEWETLINFFNEYGVPLRSYTEELATDQTNAGRRVIPIEVICHLFEVPQMVAIVVEEDGVTCAICLDEMQLGSTASRLPCHHFYHERCIEVALLSNRSCPVCRFRLD